MSSIHNILPLDSERANNQISQYQKLRFGNLFGKNISNLIFGVAISEFNQIILHHVSDKMILDIKVFRTSMMNWILCQPNGTLIIIKKCCRMFLFLTYLIKNFLKP